MYLIIKDVAKAKEVMKTNRDYKVGDKITGDAVMISKLAVKNTDAFEVGGVDKAPEVKTKKRGNSKKREKFGPSKDKMMDQEETKSKSE